METSKARYGISEKVVKMVKMFHDGFRCAVNNAREIGRWFDIKTGVKQECNISGFLFLIIYNGLDYDKNRCKLREKH